MADNYLQFSVSWAVTPSEAAWIETVLTDPPGTWFGEDVADTDQSDFADLLGFEWKISGAESCELWIWAEESADLDVVCSFLQAFLRAFRPEESLGFTYAETCSKMRPGEFSGGGCVVTADGMTFINAQDWMQVQLDGAKLNRQAKATGTTLASIRLIVCFDIDAETPSDAYAVLAEKVGSLGLAWETSDEWYASDGEAGSPAELQAAIMQHIQQPR